MKRFATTLLLGASYVAADCQSVAFGASSDPYFAWLISGTNDQRAANVSAVCAPQPNTAKTNFDNKLNELINACVPNGTDVSTSAFGVVASLLNKVMCERKTDVGALRYCILSLLPLFDVPYLFTLSQGNFQPPPLSTVAQSLDRQGAMCISNVCNSFIENIVPGLLSTLPATSAAVIAGDLVRSTVSSMRCGCVGKTTPCHHPSVTGALLKDGVFVDAVACDANGRPTECARNHMNCNASIAPPNCVKPCPLKVVASINFTLENLNYDCLANAGNIEANIKSDVIANVPGLLRDDFTCACSASVAPAVGTTCSCNVTCAGLLALKDVDLPIQFASLATRASAIVVPTPTLDKLLPASCKITSNTDSYGSSFKLLGASLAPSPSNDSSGASAMAAVSVFALGGLLAVL